MAFDFDPMHEDLDGIFGEAVTYTAPGAEEGASVTGRWQDDEPMGVMDEDGETQHFGARFTVRSTNLAAPVREAVVTQNSLDWTVVRVIRRRSEAFTLLLTRSEIIERRPGGTRRHRNG
jgi:hypothetical protein